MVTRCGAEGAEIADGAALWTKAKSDISAADYTDFYRSMAGQFDEPALTIHFRAEGRHEYTALAFIPGSIMFLLTEEGEEMDDAEWHEEERELAERGPTPR